MILLVALPNLQLPAPLNLTTLNRKLADIYGVLSKLSFGTTGTAKSAVVLADAPTVRSLNISNGVLAYDQAIDIGFVVQFQNVGAVLEHRISANDATSTGSANIARLNGRIAAAATSFIATPSVDAATDFVSGVGVDAALPYFILFDTAPQMDGDETFWNASVVTNLGLALQVGTFIRDSNVKGVTRRRLALYITKNDGTNFNMTTANITPAGKYVVIRFRGLVR